MNAYGLTLEEWRQWAETASRNYTDPSIGDTTKQKRSQDALASAVHTAPDNAVWSVEARKRGATLPTTHESLRGPTGPMYPREHGSYRGYRQHFSRDDLPACTECRIAHNTYRREQARRTR